MLKSSSMSCSETATPSTGMTLVRVKMRVRAVVGGGREGWGFDSGEGEYGCGWVGVGVRV